MHPSKPPRGVGGSANLHALMERWGIVLVSACLATLACCRWSSILSVPEFAVLDQHMATRVPRKPDPRIALVGIERPEVENFQHNRPPDCTCGLVSRDRIARAVHHVKAAGARVVVLDISFAQSCPCGLPGPRAHDGPLREALSEPPDTVVVANAHTTPERMDFFEPPDSVVDPSRVWLASPVLYNPHGVIRGVSLVQEGTPTEFDRRAIQPLEVIGGVFPPVGLVAFGAYIGHGADIPTARRPGEVEFAGLRIPVWPSESIHLLDLTMLAPRPVRNDNAMLIN
jgi:CHASE2 domain-containing sensor protein